jgi:hypothetical protein
MTTSTSELSTAELMQLCEAHFLLPPIEGGGADGGAQVPAVEGEPVWAPRRQPNSALHFEVEQELRRRAATEIAAWALELLHHYDFDAWELGASLLGTLAKADRIPGDSGVVVKALCELVARPVREDNKQHQAKDAAVSALAELGAVAALQTITDPELAFGLERARSRARERAAQRTEARRASRAAAGAAQRWRDEVAALPAEQFRPYAASARWAVGDAIAHPKLGWGLVIREVDVQKVEVLFEEGVRVLVRARPV